MSPNALAIVFSPNMFKCIDGMEGFREQSITNSIVGMFIEDYDIIFKASEVFLLCLIANFENYIQY
jgi:hypothetical protein